MPEILRLTCDDWELSVWTKHNRGKRDKLQKTMSARSSILPTSEVRFSQAILFSEVLVDGSSQIFDDLPQTKFFLPLPLFFENTLYDFEFIFKTTEEDLKQLEPSVSHKLNVICDAFHYINRNELPRLSGRINFANDIGWFRLPLCYVKQGRVQEISLSFEVFPTKMDMHTDLEVMNQVLDRDYPLWRFSQAEKTEQALDRSQRVGAHFPLLWLAQFESLRTELNTGVRQILNAPHNRLLFHTRYRKAERLTGKISARLGEKVRENMAAQQFHRSYQVQQKQLSVDTPENRFVKMVLETSHNRLSAFEMLLSKADQSPEDVRLSAAFFEQLKAWKKPLGRFRNHALFKEVGDFKELQRASLVLQQKTGYAKVYKIWQQLKLYLDVLGSQAFVSMKSVAELYEVWCFLEIRRILVDDLDFTVKNKDKVIIKQKDFELKMQDGIGAAVHLSRADGIKIKLAHEPIFEKDKGELKSWLVRQKPDIYMKVSFADGKHFVWLFDAKYRIENNERGENYDEVPNDAINQMHRYRDALIHLGGQNNEKKSRPVLGAYALYPGFFDQTENNNPYKAAIDEIGIGAFPLLPSEKGSFWLCQFLREKLGVWNPVTYERASSERYFIEDSVRVPYYGMQQILYRDLTLVLPAAPKERRDEYYVDRFFDGSASWYHTPLATTEAKHFPQHAIRELKYCAIATQMEDETEPTVKWVWPVRSVIIKPRHELTVEQSGYESSKRDLYWLFELGQPLQLANEIKGFGSEGFARFMKLTLAQEFESKTRLDDLKEVYSKLVVP